jgi:hypothetical protein
MLLAGGRSGHANIFFNIIICIDIIFNVITIFIYRGRAAAGAEDVLADIYTNYLNK